MKNLALLLALFCISITSSLAQVSVEGVDINALPEVKYCQLLGYNKALIGKNIIIVVDYGQKFKPFQSQVIKGPDGKPTEFNTMIDALNFMEANGWEYVNNYAISTGNSSTYHYLLRRKE